MNGVALAELIRETNPNLKVVIASGNLSLAPSEDIAHTLVRKPYAPHVVVNCIERLLAIPRATRTLVHGRTTGPAWANTEDCRRVAAAETRGNLNRDRFGTDTARDEGGGPVPRERLPALV
jgi:hypothetical protein